MDIRKIKKLIELAEESGITEIEVRSGDEAVRIVRPGPAAVPAAILSTPDRAQPARTAPSGVRVLAPMAGTFYAGPAPGARPFVQPGQSVQAGDVVCIIESMKMMNEIRVEQDGRVAAVLVDDAQPVAAGQALLQLD